MFCLMQSFYATMVSFHSMFWHFFQYLWGYLCICILCLGRRWPNRVFFTYFHHNIGLVFMGVCQHITIRIQCVYIFCVLTLLLDTWKDGSPFCVLLITPTYIYIFNSLFIFSSFASLKRIVCQMMCQSIKSSGCLRW